MTSEGYSKSPTSRSMAALGSDELAVKQHDLAADDLRSMAKSAMLSGGAQRTQDQMGGFCAGQQSILQMINVFGRDLRSQGSSSNEPLSDSDEDRDDSHTDPMSSSLHAIHKSASSAGSPVSSRYELHPSQDLSYDLHPDSDSSSDEEDVANMPSAENLPRPQVDPSTPLPADSPPADGRRRQGSSSSLYTYAELPKHARNDRSAGDTVDKRDILAQKLKDIFGLAEKEEIVAEYSAFLFRSVLLQGYLYLTKGHLCFYAYLKAKEGQVVRSGSFKKKASKSRRYLSRWFVLKDAVLSWYRSSTDPYFPAGDVSLHYVTSVEPSIKNSKHFKIVTADRVLSFATYSTASRNEWVKVLKKAVFQCQNEGDSVKVAIPLSRVVSVAKTSLEIIDALSVRVCDQENGNSIETYPFCYFANLQEVYEKVDELVNQAKAGQSNSTPGRRETYLDTTVHLLPEKSISLVARQDEASSEIPVVSKVLRASSMSGALLSDWARKLRSYDSSSSATAPSSDTRANTSDVLPTSTPPDSSVATLRQKDAMSVFNNPSAPAHSSTPSSSSTAHTYPPQTDLQGDSTNDASLFQNWVVPGVPVWMRSAPRKVAAATPGLNSLAKLAFGETNSGIKQSPQPTSDFPEESGDTPLSHELTHYNLPAREEVLKREICCLFRGIPIVGKVCITSSYVLFRSMTPLSNTKMILPIKDVIAAQNSKAYRFGYAGLVIVVRGHEELFFEFTAKEGRNSIRHILDQQIESQRRSLPQELESPLSPQRQEALDLEALISPKESSFDAHTDKASDLPPVMFQSTSSSFVTFRPDKPLRFSCLTIGSRGDVQPYIALCKGLIAEGHKCKIASHPEYRGWVEGHGIDFAPVGGDPAELMKICVDNGMFTVAFIREGLAKFRGWLDELLVSSWQACQHSDVIIESPSTMGGIHIAEALQVPYYRAFTMTWTRTRAYPHAFAVPEVKLGGQYNYMTYTMFDTVFWRAIAGQVNRWRKTTLGLQSTNMDKMDQQKTPFLYNFSPSVVPPPLDWPEWVHVTGYWFLDTPDDSAHKQWNPSPSLLEFIQKARSLGKKLVYIGFGSIVVQDSEALTRTVSDAVERSGVCAIVSKGWSARLSTSGDTAATKAAQEEQERRERELMSGSIYTVDSIPHDWLFERIDAACHHGGSGTTGASLRAGLPTIVRPFFGDQYFQADRVEALGVGTALRRLTVDSLAKALVAATSNEKQILRARAIGEEIRKENGVATAIETIFRDYDYAKSLIKTNTRLPSAGQTAQSNDHLDLSSSRRRSISESSWDNSYDQMEDLSSEDVLSRSGLGSTPHHSDKELVSSEDESRQPPPSIMTESKSH